MHLIRINRKANILMTKRYFSDLRPKSRRSYGTKNNQNVTPLFYLYHLWNVLSITSKKQGFIKYKMMFVPRKIPKVWKNDYSSSAFFKKLRCSQRLDFKIYGFNYQHLAYMLLYNFSTYSQKTARHHFDNNYKQNSIVDH